MLESQSATEAPEIRQVPLQGKQMNMDKQIERLKLLRELAGIMETLAADRKPVTISKLGLNAFEWVASDPDQAWYVLRCMYYEAWKDGEPSSRHFCDEYEKFVIITEGEDPDNNEIHEAACLGWFAGGALVLSDERLRGRKILRHRPARTAVGFGYNTEEDLDGFIDF